MKDEHMEHGSHEELIQVWEDQLPVFEEIKSLGFQKYAESLNINVAFELGDRCLRCMDEGTPGGVHMAGSGILDKELAKKVLVDAQVEGIYSHEGCGAVALFAKQQGLDLSQADQYGIDWARELAAATKLPYKGHITSQEMTRPSEFHVARVAYLDGTGKFDPSRAPGLPQGFVVSRKFFTPEYAAQELQIAASIAMGDHGFGPQLITRKNPFMVVVISKQSESNQVQLMAEAAKAMNGNDRILIQGASL